MIGLHLACNEKILQLAQGTYFHEEEEVVVQVGNWSVMLVFERERIVGKIVQSSYRNGSQVGLDRASPSEPDYRGGTCRSSDGYASLFGLCSNES